MSHNLDLVWLDLPVIQLELMHDLHKHMIALAFAPDMHSGSIVPVLNRAVTA